jgi:hypothetical protein
MFTSIEIYALNCRFAIFFLILSQQFMKLQESMVLKFFVLSSPYQKAEPLFTHLENFISNLSDNTIMRLPYSHSPSVRSVPGNGYGWVRTTQG